MPNDSPTAASNEADPPSREYRVRICDQCYWLQGEMCHNPSCVFCRRTMKEVADYLDALLIRPLVDGERMDLYVTPRPTPDIASEVGE